MTIDEALTFIHGVPWRGSKPGLSRTRELLARLGDPHRRLAFVHIAGTNGKGSTAAMLSSILAAAGYRTGLYTSPFIGRFNERMRINGEKISDDALSGLTELIAPLAAAMEDSPTEFEIITALGFKYFADRDCDVVVLETGMGGRLDSTNVIDPPECAVITRIGLDHTAELGATVEEIAMEKCGIIKPGCRAVLYAQDESVMSIVRRRCEDAGVPLAVSLPAEIESISDSVEGQVFKYRGRGEYRIRLLGEHQLKNAAVVIETADVLRGAGRPIPEEAVKAGLDAAVWPARFEIVSRNPWVVVDGGHNPQCAESVVDGIRRYFAGQSAVFLVGVLADKDYAAICRRLAPAAAAFVTVTPNNPRALPAADLAEHLTRYGRPVASSDSIADGVAKAREMAGENGLVVAVGSLFMASEIRACFGLRD